MSFKVLSGPYLNHLTRTASAPTMTPSALALFPAVSLFDNRSSRPGIFGTASSESVLTANLNLLFGDFESTGQAATWTMLGVGTVSQSSSTSYAGTYSAVVTKENNAIEAIAYKDVTVRSGEELTFVANAESLTTGDSAQVRIRNRQTANWLSTALSWGSTQSNVLATAGTTWESISLKFNVESLATCITDTVTLRIYLRSGDGSVGYFDDIGLWPSVNWCSVHGHNIPPFVVPRLQYSDDNSTWSTGYTMTLRRDSFYLALAQPEAHHYWRLFLDGRPDTGSLMYMGEVVMGQYYDIIHNPLYASTLKWQERQTRLESDIGDQFVHLHNQAPQRTLLLSHIFPSSSSYAQFRDPIFRGSRGGGNLVCIAPEEMDSSVVILGRIRDSVDVVKHTPVERTSQLEITEAPLPNATEVAAAYDAPIEAPE